MIQCKSHARLSGRTLDSFQDMLAMKRVFKKNDDPLVNSKERIVLLFPVLNRLRNGCQMFICLPHMVFNKFCLFVLL